MDEADIIWSQISRSTKMACGVRKPTKGTDGNRPYLIFQVTIKPSVKNFVKVTLDPSDTYTVKLLQYRGENVKEVESHEDIYNDNLSEVIYRMCNK
jgi:hypothetical protein